MAEKPTNRPHRGTPIVDTPGAGGGGGSVIHPRREDDCGGGSDVGSNNLSSSDDDDDGDDDEGEDEYNPLLKVRRMSSSYSEPKFPPACPPAFGRSITAPSARGATNRYLGARSIEDFDVSRLHSVSRLGGAAAGAFELVDLSLIHI